MTEKRFYDNLVKIKNGDGSEQLEACHELKAAITFTPEHATARAAAWLEIEVGE